MAITLDSRFIVSPPLQEIFRDKDTGLPLRNGYVEFYHDNDRVTPKDVYIQTGVPGAYTAVSIGSVVQLSMVGGFIYMNNEVSILYFPYLEDSTDPILDKYFVRVFNEFGIPQFTRENWPIGLSDENTTDDSFNNYIENGQFKIHRDGSNSIPVASGTTYLDYGPWQYQTPDGSSTVDYVFFERFGSQVTTPPFNPRFTLRTRCATPNPADGFKVIEWRNNDCNFFASEINFLNFQFYAKNNLGGPTLVVISIFKNFGTGGSPDSSFTIGNFLIQPGYNPYSINFIMGENPGAIIGPNGDDYLRVEIGVPTDQSHDINWTDFSLRDGSFSFVSYPERTVAQYRSATLPVPIPSYDGTDEGKVPVLTPIGLQFFNMASIGEVSLSFNTTKGAGWIFLYTDGLTFAKNSGASFNGEIYRKLYNVLHPVASCIIQGGIKNPDPNVDFDNNLFLIFPPIPGRALAAAGTGSGLTARANGQNLGLEGVSLTGPQNGPHAHLLDPNEALVSPDSTTTGGGSLSGARPYPGAPGITPSTQISGTGAAHENMQPTVFLNAFIYYGG